MSDVNVKELRKQARHYLSYDIAHAVGMRLDQLEQFIAGTYRPTEEQMRALARRMRMDEVK